jgi:hypothetical protein
MTFLASVSGKFSATAQVKSSGGASMGQQAFVAPGTYTWIAPPGVTKVSAVCIGGGGSGYRSWSSQGGGGGGLGWKNNIPVSPGSSYTVVVGDAGRDRYGAAGGTSYFIGTGTVSGYGGGNPTSGSSTSGPNSNSYGGGWTGDGGGAGGNPSYGGGGAGGYTGRGGGQGETMWGYGYGAASGGCYYSSTYGSGGGGGVGIWGKGYDGYYFTSCVGAITTASYGGGGNGGSGGGRGHYGENPFISPGYESYTPAGGNYGGGGGGSGTSGSTFGGPGGVGAVRLIWGQGRAFPDTNTGDVAPALQVPFPTTGDAVYTYPGTYTWTCPPGVSSISVVCVGGGGSGYGPWTGTYGGSGGGLGYKNNYPVTPGSTYTVRVGYGGFGSTQGQSSYFVSLYTVSGWGGGNGANGYGSDGNGPNSNSYGGGWVGDNGGAGGTYTSYAGAGAGGYGYSGGNSNVNGQGGGGAGGYPYSSTYGGGGGGGVGLYGQGSNGLCYNTGWYPYSTGNAVGYGRMGAYAGSVGSAGTSGGGGSGGENGFAGENGPYTYGEGGGNSGYPGSRGGNCGGGGGPGGTSYTRYSHGGVGGVRIVWPGSTRQFPSTNVGDAVGDTMYGRGYWGGSSVPDGRGTVGYYTHMFGPNGVREPQSPVNNYDSTYIPYYQPTLGQA